MLSRVSGVPALEENLGPGAPGAKNFLVRLSLQLQAGKWVSRRTERRGLAASRHPPATKTVEARSKVSSGD